MKRLLVFILMFVMASGFILLSQPAMADDVDKLINKQKSAEKLRVEKQNKEELRRKACADRVDQVTHMVEKIFEELLNKGVKFESVAENFSDAEHKHCSASKYGTKLYSENYAKCRKIDRVDKIGHIYFFPTGNLKGYVQIEIIVYEDNHWKMYIYYGNQIPGSRMGWSQEFDKYTMELRTIFDSKEVDEKKKFLRQNIVEVIGLTQ